MGFIRALLGKMGFAGSRNPARRVPSPIPYPNEDIHFMRDDHEFAPKMREALHELQSTQRQQRPIVQPALPLAELVAEWERLGGHFINQVQYVHDMHRDLGRLRSQIDERLASRNEQLEAEFTRNEELRARIGGGDAPEAKPDPIPDGGGSPDGNVLPIVGHSEPSQGNGKDHSGELLITNRGPEKLPRRSSSV